ncbi:TetR family transcriptional regulator [Nocardia sp. NPDC024068]|uniref:TetR family transcriptional regulator n=1 Tax=Nocardia sp. NPDC024068 TaxID=3157197 RepID=UPI0033F701C0
MQRRSEAASAEQIIVVVQEMLESQGYAAVQLRAVARRAHVSLATVYKSFATRDELIVTAVERWMAVNNFSPAAPTPDGENPRSGLVRILRHILAPWETHPRMLEAYHRARLGPGGRRLDERAISEVLPAISALFAGAEPDYVSDVGLILSNMIYALIGRFVDGALEVTEILPALERTVIRLTSDNEAPSNSGAARLSQPESDTVVDASLAGPYGPKRPS